MILTIARYHILIIIIAALMLCMALPAQAVRIKDITTFSGVRDNQLIGYGLVVGLAGTGDKKDSVFTTSSMANMMDRMGVGVDAAKLKVKNVAAVMVTARMPVSAKPGSPLDVTISSVGDATSLLGGVLLQTPLKGIDGKIYSMAQGSLTLGGFTAEGAAARTSKNITTVGFIPGGGIVERAIPFEFNNQSNLTLSLRSPDFSTSQRIAEILNSAMGGNFAHAVDAASVELSIPPHYKGNMVPLMASVENLEISPDTPAKVVVIMSAEYILAGGNKNVILCERGIRTFETATRNTLDLSAIPVIKEQSHLPVVVDPSHATGFAKYVKPMSLAAVAAGADGLMVEVHNNPTAALCDGQQSLTPEAFADLAIHVARIRDAIVL